MGSKSSSGHRLFLLFILSIALTACGGGVGRAPAAIPRFAYVANDSDNTVSLYTVNATTGQLRHNGYVGAGTNPVSVVVDPSRKFAF